MTTTPGDLEDLAHADLDRAHESLYFAARRYCTITDQGFLQKASNVDRDDPSFVSVGAAAHDLAEAGHRYTEAYERWEKYLPPGESDGGA